jgi:hypothetical protein
MLFDAIERVYTVTNANFNADVNTLLTAKGVTVFSATVLKRETAEIMRAKYQTFPAVGIYAIDADTQMADGGLGGKRDSDCAVAADLVIVGTDPVLVQEQVELGCEVLVKEMCDRVPTGATTTFAGGLQRRSVKVSITDGYTDEQGVNYMAIGTVRVPVFDRDNTT